MQLQRFVAQLNAMRSCLRLRRAFTLAAVTVYVNERSRISRDSRDRTRHTEFASSAFNRRLYINPFCGKVSLSDADEDSLPQRIYIAGYGVAGKAATNQIVCRLKQISAEPNFSAYRITVVDNVDYSQDILDTYGEDVEFIRGRIVGVSSEGKTLELSDGETLPFDKCLLALGKDKPSASFYDSFVEKGANIYHYLDPHVNLHLSKVLNEGGHVTVIGNDWKAIESVCKLGAVSSSSGYGNNISLVSSDFLMASRLPKYLSVAVAKRLKARFNVEIIPMTQVQYLGGPSTIPRSLLRAEKADLAVYASGTYDSMGSLIFGTNAALLVKDELASLNIEADLERDSNGAFVVNHSLAATSSIWVAGDMASLYTENIGRGVFQGNSHAISTGRTAAASLLGEDVVFKDIAVLECFAPEVGVQMAFIGNCSTALNTYGYWWRPPRRRPTSVDNNLPTRGSNDSFISNLKFKGQGQVARLKKKEVHLGNANVTRVPLIENPKSIPKAVYGEGFLFYLNNDVISGILLNTDQLQSTHQKEALYDRMKGLIGQSVAPQDENSSATAAAGEQYSRYAALLSIANSLLGELRCNSSDEPSDVFSERHSTPQFIYCPASRATLRAVTSGAQSIMVGPNLPADTSFTDGSSSTISSAEITSNAYRKGLLRR